MADPTNPPGNTPQGQPLQQVGDPAKSKNTFRAKWQNNWLRRLRSLPESVYRQCVYRLQRGEPAHGVAVWLLALPHRGGMQSVTSIWTAEKYLQVLREYVRAAQKRVPAPLDPKRAVKLAEQRKQADNVVSIFGGHLSRETPPEPPKPTTELAVSLVPAKRVRRSKIQRLVDENAQTARMLAWVNYGLSSFHEKMELCDFMEDKVTMPLELSNKLLQTLALIIDKGLKAEAALAKSSGNWQNFGALTIEGIMADKPAQAQVVNGGTVIMSSPAAPTPGIASGSAPTPAPDKPTGLPPRLEHLREQVSAMKVEDRMLLRTVLDQVLHIMDLKIKIKRAEEAKAAAATAPPQPSPPEEGR